METIRKRVPSLAFLLSLFFAGLGQVYNGQIKKAIIVFLIFLLPDVVESIVVRCNPSAAYHISFWVLALVAGLVVSFGIAFEAFFTARKLKEYSLRPSNRWYVYLLWIAGIIVFVSVARNILIKTANADLAVTNFFKAYTMRGNTMRPTLFEGDKVVVETQYFKSHPLQRGDLLVFQVPEAGLSAEEKASRVKKDFIKRCVAIAGDTVEIKDKVLYVNRQKVDEKFVQHTDAAVFPAARLFPTAAQYQQAWEAGKFAGLPVDTVRDNFGPVTVPPDSIFTLGDNREQSFDSRFWGPVNVSLLKGKPVYIYSSKDRKRIGKP